jgi:hypothetical protein
MSMLSTRNKGSICSSFEDFPAVPAMKNHGVAATHIDYLEGVLVEDLQGCSAVCIAEFQQLGEKRVRGPVEASKDTKQ